MKFKLLSLTLAAALATTAVACASPGDAPADTAPDAPTEETAPVDEMDEAEEEEADEADAPDAEADAEEGGEDEAAE
jgi:hypothetical protein